ncbi:hypothetical protein BRADI_3g19405v3 [Brachypodium distachyon]|uniref:Uncharacterized protein n=1 Tax=Brachypodium distachyon TaxID=15368 RepID=A0A2K2CY92_BRADI|nr:hypothetical protein BRADI_3g19405v3 [Brachypodium distachyon]
MGACLCSNWTRSSTGSVVLSDQRWEVGVQVGRDCRLSCSPSRREEPTNNFAGYRFSRTGLTGRKTRSLAGT